MNETKFKDFSSRTYYNTFHKMSRHAIWSIIVVELSRTYYYAITTIMHCIDRWWRNKDFLLRQVQSQLFEVPDDQGNEVKTSARLCYDILKIFFFFAAEETWSPTTSPTFIKIHKTIFINCARYYTECPKTVGCLLNH